VSAPSTTELLAPTVHDRLIGLLTDRAARYRLIDHEPEGRTAPASKLRGHALAQAAKCIIARIKLGKETTRYVLAVIPGDQQVNLNRLRQLYGGTSASLAKVDTAEHLAGTVSGTIVPFSFVAELELIVDPSLLVHETIFFNAARLDQSIELDTQDYLAISNPRVKPIVQVVPADT